MKPLDPPIPPSSGGRRFRWIALATIVGVATLAVLQYARFLETALLGFDCYPTIITARIESFADLLGTFTEELMDGRFSPGGRFYRPLTNLTFAGDYALGGLDPSAYHRTDLLILIANALVIFAFAVRLLGRKWAPAAAFAAIVFVLHPIHVEVLPVPPRRADALFLTFLLASLAAQPRTAAQPLRSLASALLALAAVATKETGAIVLPLSLCLGFLDSSRLGSVGCGGGQPSVLGRARTALWHSRLTIAAVLLFLVLRPAVLGGMGGHPSASIFGLFNLWGVVDPVMDLLLLPGWYQAPKLIVLGIFALIIVAVFAGWRLERKHGGDESDSATSGRALTLLALLFAGLLALTSMSGAGVWPWYALGFGAPYVIVLGVLMQLGVRALGRGSLASALPILALPVILAANQVRFSPLVHVYERWFTATDRMNEFLARFDAEVETAPSGSAIILDQLPLLLPGPESGPGVQSAAMINTYTLQAYADLTVPERRVKAHRFESGDQPVAGAADELHVWVTPLRMTRRRRQP